MELEPSPPTTRSLRTHYLGWTKQYGDHLESAVKSGLIVMDSNVLLTLYEVGASAREETFAVLETVVNRIWVPHQVALEFSRNRRRVVLDRVREFGDVRKAARTATKEAVDVLDDAIEAVVRLRGKTRSSRDWGRSVAGLDRNSLEQRLAGSMDALINEVQELEAEHDLRPEHLESLDAVFTRIDALLRNRIGTPIVARHLRALVSEAIDFRYPNEIPPGYRDQGKTTDLAAAGDYLLWWETLRYAASSSSYIDVLLITGDQKDDWWRLDDHNRPVGPRPELIQEMQDESGKRLTFATLATFLDGANQFLETRVSDDTLKEVRDAELSITSFADIDAQASAQINLLSISSSELEQLVLALFQAMGYDSDRQPGRGNTRVDLLVRDSRALVPGDIVVEVKRYMRVVPSEVIHQVIGAMSSMGVPQGMIITTSHFSRSAHSLARKHSIRLIDGQELVKLIREHLGLRATTGLDSTDDIDAERE